MFRISTLEPFQDHQDPRTNAPWKVLKMDEDGLSHELFNIKDALFHLTYRCLQSLPALSHKRQAFAASQELHLKLSKQDQIHSCLSIAIVSHLCDISTGKALASGRFASGRSIAGKSKFKLLGFPSN